MSEKMSGKLSTIVLTAGASIALLIGGAATAAEGLHILAPRDGETVDSPLTVVMDLGGAGHLAQPGHPHLLVDAPLPDPGTRVPMDERHVHLAGGQARTVLPLAPGRHTLQLIMAGNDHVVPKHAPRSERLTITVR
jgi:hypothetical protein